MVLFLPKMNWFSTFASARQMAHRMNQTTNFSSLSWAIPEPLYANLSASAASPGRQTKPATHTIRETSAETSIAGLAPHVRFHSLLTTCLTWLVPGLSMAKIRPRGPTGASISTLVPAFTGSVISVANSRVSSLSFTSSASATRASPALSVALQDGGGEARCQEFGGLFFFLVRECVCVQVTYPRLGQPPQGLGVLLLAP